VAYAGKRCLVMTREKHASSKHGEVFNSDPPKKLVARLTADGAKRIYVDGSRYLELRRMDDAELRRPVASVGTTPPSEGTRHLPLSPEKPWLACASMPSDVPLRCRCGRVQGIAIDASPSSGFRFVCYCKDCQAFARFLDRADVLDLAGGTDIFQMPPARVNLTAGTDAMRCLRFSGKVLRWYTDCCRTPIANTAAGPRFPIVAVIHSFMDHDADGRSRDDVLGPPLCRIFEGSAVGPLPPKAPPPPSLRVFAGRASKMLGWWARGLARPTPFFDERTKAPLSVPRVLTPSERATANAN
jgi:hypothetical protein